MSPSPKQGSRRATRHELDSLVVNIELTLSSIIQGVALSVLTESSRGPLGNLRFDQWPYVLNGLLIILLFWSRSVSHMRIVTRNGCHCRPTSWRAPARWRSERQKTEEPRTRNSEPQTAPLRQCGYERSFRLGRNVPKTPEKKEDRTQCPNQGDQKEQDCLGDALFAVKQPDCNRADAQRNKARSGIENDSEDFANFLWRARQHLKNNDGVEKVG